MNVIITGSTGMVGKGVLLECLDDNNINQILLLNRSPIDIKHSKIREILHKDFADFKSIQQEFKGYDACFHCMGVSSVGMAQEQYYKLTYGITAALVNTIYQVSPNLTFIYVSGEGTDSTEKSKTMWARVKGKTENLIFNKGFKDAYAFRPGVILPERGIKSKTNWYNLLYSVMRPIYPILKRMKSVTTTQILGKAMITLIENPQNRKILIGSDINNVRVNK